MKKPKIVTHSDMTINLERVKCFRISNTSNSGDNKTLIIEFNTRYDYIFNPSTKKFEKQEYNETCEVKYNDYEIACAYRNEWEEIWQDYLEEQN